MKLRLLIACLLLPAGSALPAEYTVVVSKATHADAGWHKVVEALVKKHQASILTYDAAVEEALPGLKKEFPRYACFVATPSEAGREFVAAVHKLTRQLDDDPYTDCFWGILTGYDASNALRIASCAKPLTVRKVASGTEIALEMCEEGLWYDELVQGKMVKKEKGGQARQLEGPADSTEALVKTLNEYKADAFVTSGHASERDWSIGYGYRNGSFRCKDGVLFGLDTKGNRYPVNSPNPKVYLPIGNCLMGHIDGPNCMALAYMNSAGVNQMIGYTVPTGYGYGGWGCLDYFLEQPGRYTFTEAFFANQAAMIHRLQADKNPGLRGDRDVVAFYGDPAWEARMAKQKCAWDQTLVEKRGTWTFTIKPNRGEQTFEPINRNGSERGYRPIVQFFPRRLTGVEIIEGSQFKPVITDNFILVPNPQTCDPKRDYRIVFRAKQ
jgi:zinc protease